MAVSPEPRHHRSRVRRSRRGTIPRRWYLVVGLPVRRPPDRRTGRSGERPDAGLRVRRAQAHMASASRLSGAARRGGIRPADDRTVRRRRPVGLPMCVRSGGDGERWASAVRRGAVVRLLWCFRRLISDFGDFAAIRRLPRATDAVHAAQPATCREKSRHPTAADCTHFI